MIGNLTASKDNVHAPAGTLFVRDLQVYTSTSVATGENSFLIKKDISYLREYDAAETTTGTPKYYAMSGGAEGTGATSSGRITVGKRDSAGDVTATDDFYYFTVDTNTATSGGVSGGGNNCTAGPATLEA